jgi:hemolysin III
MTSPTAPSGSATAFTAPVPPRLRGRIHQAAFLAAIPAGFLLVWLAPTPRARIGTLVFSVSMLAQFGVSASYHVGRWNEVQRRRMRVLDHSAIFVLIAGTYTPFCLLVLHGETSTAMLAVVWAGAAAGIGTKLYRVDLHVLSGFLYLGLGWVAVVTLPSIVRALDGSSTALLIAGGLLYSFGALVLALHRPNPWPRTFGYHEIWHSMTVAAATCHYVVIVGVVLSARV